MLIHSILYYQYIKNKMFYTYIYVYLCMCVCRVRVFWILDVCWNSINIILYICICVLNIRCVLAHVLIVLYYCVYYYWLYIYIYIYRQWNRNVDAPSAMHSAWNAWNAPGNGNQNMVCMARFSLFLLTRQLHALILKDFSSGPK